MSAKTNIRHRVNDCIALLFNVMQCIFRTHESHVKLLNNFLVAYELEGRSLVGDEAMKHSPGGNIFIFLKIWDLFFHLILKN